MSGRDRPATGNRMICRERGRRRQQRGAMNPARLAAFGITVVVLLWFGFSVLHTKTAQRRALSEAEQPARERREAIAGARERAMASVDAIADRVPDQALLGCIRTAMKDIAGTARGTDATLLDGIEDIHRLRCAGEGVARLDGLHRVPNIEHLDLSDNDVEDLAPLRELGRLEIVRLDHNPFADLTPLAYHPSLTRVSLEGDTVEKLDPVLTIPNLASLGLPDAIEIACRDAISDLRRHNVELDDDPASIACSGF